MTDKISRFPWRSYLPALSTLGLGIFFLMFPLLAAFLVSGLFFAFAVLYAMIVYRIQQARRMAGESSGVYYSSGTREEPSFRNVTVRMYREVPFFRDLN